MKVTLALLCIIPMVLCAPERKLFESLGLEGGSQFSLEALKSDIRIVQAALEQEPTEQMMEDQCYNLIQQGNVLNYGCPIVRLGYRKLVVSDSKDLAAPEYNKARPNTITTIV